MAMWTTTRSYTLEIEENNFELVTWGRLQMSPTPRWMSFKTLNGGSSLHMQLHLPAAAAIDEHQPRIVIVPRSMSRILINRSI